MLSTIALLTGIAVLAIISPGPDLFLILRNSARYTRRAALATVAGITLGITVHIIYCMLGIGLLISKSILLFGLVKYAGAAYLIYIGVKSLRASGLKLDPVAGGGGAGQSDDWCAALMEGLLCNVTNPKVTLMMLSVFTQVVRPDTGPGEQAIYGSVFVVVSIVYWSGLVLLVQRRAVRDLLSRARASVDRVFGALLIGLGVKVVFSG